MSEILYSVIIANCTVMLVAVAVLFRYFRKPQTPPCSCQSRPPEPPKPEWNKAKKAYPAPTGKRKPKIIDDYRGIEIEREHADRRKPLY